jgi:hypothetical protein
MMITFPPALAEQSSALHSLIIPVLETCTNTGTAEEVRLISPLCSSAVSFILWKILVTFL